MRLFMSATPKDDTVYELRNPVWHGLKGMKYNITLLNYIVVSSQSSKLNIFHIMKNKTILNLFDRKII